MEGVIVTRQVLDLYDKYEGDFGLLDERWASEEDRQKVTVEQITLFTEYVDMLHLIKLDVCSAQIKGDANKRIAELEKVVDREVAEILRTRVPKM